MAFTGGFDAGFSFGFARDGAWLLIPDYLNWIGVWSSTYAYSRDDVVIYQDGDLRHAFVSKTDHNIGNVPATAYLYWTRLVQEKWA